MDNLFQERVNVRCTNVKQNRATISSNQMTKRSINPLDSMTGQPDSHTSDYQPTSFLDPK